MAKKNKRTNLSVSFVAKIVIGLIGLFFIVILFGKMTSFIKNAGYFTVRNVLYHPSLQFMASRELGGLVGKNIFSVNLKKTQRQLQERYPEISQLRVTRRFPNQIYVVARKRLPFGLIHIGEATYVVDEEGTVLPVRQTTEFILPVIEGVHPKGFYPQVGLTIKDNSLRIASRIIRTFYENKDLVSRRIQKIDVNNLSKIEVTLSDNLKVILDPENTLRKFQILALVFSNTQADFNTVKYIDLRFKQPVLGKADSIK